MRSVLSAAIFSLALPATAEAPKLMLPIDCKLGETCHIQQFVDHDPGPGATDFACGFLSYDGHKGTDIAVPTLAAQASGVAVLAAAPGRVRGVRDEMPDILQGTSGAPDVSDRECGNGVVIEHGDGWETQYCHMALGSIQVAPGQEVAAGTPLGLVGLSGQTQFPHVHLSVRKDGAVVDPFAPDSPATCGEPAGPTLWADVPNTPQGGLIEGGFTAAVPDYDSVKAGTVPAATGPDLPLVLWAYAFGGREGDVMSFRITGPAGFEFDHDEVLTRTQAQLFRAVGKRAPGGGWPQGDYRGTVVHMRDGAAIDRIEVSARIGP